MQNLSYPLDSLPRKMLLPSYISKSRSGYSSSPPHILQRPTGRGSTPSLSHNGYPPSKSVPHPHVRPYLCLPQPSSCPPKPAPVGTAYKSCWRIKEVIENMPLLRSFPVIFGSPGVEPQCGKVLVTCRKVQRASLAAIAIGYSRFHPSKATNQQSR